MALVAGSLLATGQVPLVESVAAAEATSAAAGPLFGTAPDRGVQADRPGPGHRPGAADLDRQAGEKAAGGDRAASPGDAARAAETTSVATSVEATSVGSASTGSIGSSGPLTSVTTTPDLNCAVRYAGDSFGEFYGDTACGTFLSVAGVLYGPAAVPAGGDASPRTPWTPVSQTGPTASDSQGRERASRGIADAGSPAAISGPESERRSTRR